MADGEWLGAEDGRKRARQNGVIQPLLTGRFFNRISYSPNMLIIIIKVVISILRLCDCCVDCTRCFQNEHHNNDML